MKNKTFLLGFMMAAMLSFFVLSAYSSNVKHQKTSTYEMSCAVSDVTATPLFVVTFNYEITNNLASNSWCITNVEICAIPVVAEASNHRRFSHRTYHKNVNKNLTSRSRRLAGLTYKAPDLRLPYYRPKV